MSSFTIEYRIFQRLLICSNWKSMLVQGGQSLVNKQFNTPINLYSEKNLQETLSAQAEVLAGGAIGYVPYLSCC